MKVDNYYDFITESKLEMLLEANIVYMPKFREILRFIKSPLCSKLLSLRGVDVDVPTNYIDINLSKDDVVTFVPESKNKNDKFIINLSNCCFRITTKNYLGLRGSSDVAIPDTYQIGTIEKRFKIEEIRSSYPMTATSLENIYKPADDGGDGGLVLFNWGPNLDKQIIISSKALKPFVDIESLPRSEIKVGRFVKRILSKANVSVTDAEIEDFVNKFKSYIQVTNDVFSRFRIISGEDIRKYYSHRKYESGGGSLGGSCMRYDDAQPFLDIYVKNPEKVSLLLFMSKSEEDKICGRALIWQGSILDEDKSIMDRIYTNNTPDEEIFKEYAIKHKYYYKERQTYEHDQLLFNGSRAHNSNVKISLDPISYESYPYMDTYKYYVPETGTLSNTYLGGHKALLLKRTDGTSRLYPSES